MEKPSEINWQILHWRDLSGAEKKQVLARSPLCTDRGLKGQVQAIVDQVRATKDQALIQLTQQFDQVSVTALQLSPAQITEAKGQISTAVFQALKQAAQNIEAFHSRQLHGPIRVETQAGIVCERITRPIEKIGLYIPGGSAPLPSTVLMTGIPAKLAGVKNVILCSPPKKDGTIDPVILVAAELCGISEIYRVGGAQAIAAMAYGTESIPKVDKIFGPGNRWVAQAKSLVAEDPMGAAIDLPAGPSEVLVIADKGANPQFVAYDLLAQAEHGPDSQVLLISDSESLINDTQNWIKTILQSLPRKDVATIAIAGSHFIHTESLLEAIAISNQYAPEHLILNCQNARSLLEKVLNAGSVFIGPWTPESLGDYASGTNHVLPTYGYAKSYSGLAVDNFLKKITVQEASSAGLKTIGPVVEILAEVEGLHAHKTAVSVRLATIKQTEDGRDQLGSR